MSCREGRADPEMRSAKRTTLCSPDLRRYHTTLRCTFSQYTFNGPWIERFQDCCWDPEFPQLSQMVQSLPGFLDRCLHVYSPSQVLGDVYTEVLEAAHLLHRGPTDHKRNVGPLRSLPEVHNQLFSFAPVQRVTQRLAVWALFERTQCSQQYFEPTLCRPHPELNAGALGGMSVGFWGR